MHRIVTALLAATLVSCAKPSTPAAVAVDTTPTARETYGLLIVIDGAKGEAFLKYAEEGKLPNVKRYFVDEGVWVEHGTTCFPTITGAGMPTVLTGSLPANHDIPSLYFFDRQTRQYPVLYVAMEALQWNQYLHPDVKTVWEQFEGPDDALAFGPALNRGADEVVPISWGLGYKPLEYRAKVTHALRRLEQSTSGVPPARLSVLSNGWFDHVEHGLSANHPDMMPHYEAVDSAIGEAIERFYATLETRSKAIGAPVDGYVAFTSDHGHQDIHETHSIDNFVRDLHGAKVVDQVWTQVFGHPIKGDIPDDLSGHEIVVAAGEGHGLLYFPTPVLDDNGATTTLDWDRAPTLAELRDYPFRGERINVPQLAVDQVNAIDFVLGKDKVTGKVHVIGKGGEATIEKRGEGYTSAEYRWTVISGVDPFGWTDDSRTAALITGDFIGADAWQQALYATEQPDGIVQLYQAMDSSRAPDLYLSAKAHASIGDLVEGSSGSKHGGLTKDEMWTTVAFHGTGIKPGRVTTARNVDVVPTLLTMMRHPYDAGGMDGKVVPEVRASITEHLSATNQPPLP